MAGSSTCYLRHLSTMESGNFAWRTPDMGVPDTSFDWPRSVIYYLHRRDGPAAFRLGRLHHQGSHPGAAGSGRPRALFAPASEARRARGSATLSLDLAFALYLGAFIWLDVVWK